jgi:hypothetical protein
VVLCAAFTSGRPDQSSGQEPAPEAAPGDKRRRSAGEQRRRSSGKQQRHKECFGLEAARIGGNLVARREQLAALACFAYSSPA